MSIKAKNRINIHGLFPPPIGGVSVHLQRIKLLLEEQGIPFKIYNHGFAEEKNVVALKKSYLWYLGKIFKTEKDLFHFHQFVYLHFIFYFLKSVFSGSRFMITIHSSRILEYGYIKKQLALFLLKRTRYEKLLVVSKSLATFLEERGISCEFLPAYVPPIGYTTTPIEKGDKNGFCFQCGR